MKICWLFLIVLSAALLCAADSVNNVEFQPMFTAENGLELHVQNYTKLPKTLTSVEILIGGEANKAACRVMVPGITLEPAERRIVVVADVRSVNSCLPSNSPAHGQRLSGLDNIRLRNGQPDSAPLSFVRSLRIIPHFSGGASANAVQQLRFRFAE